MVAIDLDVGILLIIMESPRDLLFDDRLRCLGEVGDDFGWSIVSEENGLEEPAGSWDTAAFGHEHLDDLAMLIHGSIHVSPGARGFDAGVINKQAVANHVAAGPGVAHQYGSELLDPR